MRQGVEVKFVAGRSRPKTLRIGIASHEEVRERMMKIARGELRPRADEPKVFFPSLDSLSKVLSGKNRELLKLIREEKPCSLEDLHKSSGRAVSNLSRTLRTMERYGLVRMERGAQGRIRPLVQYDDVKIELGLAG